MPKESQARKAEREQARAIIRDPHAETNSSVIARALKPGQELHELVEEMELEQSVTPAPAVPENDSAQ